MTNSVDFKAMAVDLRDRLTSSEANNAELLEALEYCLDCLGDEFALPADCQNNARAAIAKARGEA